MKSMEWITGTRRRRDFLYNIQQLISGMTKMVKYHRKKFVENNDHMSSLMVIEKQKYP